MVEYYKRGVMKKIVIGILFFSLSLCAVNAEELVKITMQDAISVALNKNITYQAKKRDLEIAEKNIKIANKLLNPQLSTHTLIGRVTRGNNSQMGLALPVEIGKRGVRKKVAQAEYDKAKTELEQYEYNLKMDVMDAYFNILVAKSYYILMQRKERWYKKVLKMAENKKKSEPRYEVDMLRAQTKHEREKMDLNYLEANVHSAICNFNKILNTNEKDITYDTVETSLQDNKALLNVKLPSCQELEEIALKKNFELRISEDDIKIADRNVSLAKHKRIPDLYLAGGYAYQKLSVTDQYNGAYVTAAMDLPILYTYRPEIQKAKIILSRLKYNKQGYEDILRYTIQDNYNKFVLLKRNMESARKIYNDMDRILTIESKEYEENKIRLMDLMGIEESQQQYMTDFINFVSQYYKAYLELLRHLGTDLSETQTL